MSSRQKLVKRHAADLARKGLRAYEIAAAVEDALPESALGAVHPHVARLADLLVSLRLERNRNVRRGAEVLAGLGTPDAETGLRSWGETLDAAAVSRRSAMIALTELPEWFRKTPSEARPELAEGLKALAPRLGPIGAGGMGRTVMAAAKQPTAGRRKALLLSVAAAAESRPQDHSLVLTGFPKWIERFDDALEEPLLAALPKLCRSSRAAEEMIDAVLAVESPEGRAAFLETLGGVAPEAAEFLPRLVPLGRRAFRDGEGALFTELLSALGEEEVRWNSATPKLVRCLAELSGRLEGTEGERWRNGVACVVPLVRQNVSSAHYAARSIGRRIRRLDDETADAYLAGFAQLAKAIGIRAVGFAVSRLPKLYSRSGRRPAQKFVAAAVTVAEQIGGHAALLFLEGRTATAREALKG